MQDFTETRLLAVACEKLPTQTGELLRLLHRFTLERLEAARRRRQAVLDIAHEPDKSQACGAEIHSFLRDCWEVLDGLARELNVCMHHLFPSAALYPPGAITRQCTFYMVRKKLSEHPQAAGHPVTRLLWDSTRGRSAEEYERLSFLYNISLFLPLTLTVDGQLPGMADLPAAARAIIKPAHVERCSVEEGVRQILNWLESLVAQCYDQLTDAMAGTTR